jgi:hypothetical protein
MFEPYCGDCPDREACHQGYPCTLVRTINDLPQKETFTMSANSKPNNDAAKVTETHGNKLKGEATAGNFDDVRNVTPIVPEQAKAENDEKTADADTDGCPETESRLDKLKAAAKKNKRFLLGAGLAAAVTVLAVVNARKQAVAEETDEPADS